MRACFLLVTSIVLGFVVSACGSESDSDVASRSNDNDDDDAGADDDDEPEDDASDDDEPEDDASDDDEPEDDAPSAGPVDFPEPDLSELEPADPLLPDTDPQTPINELSDDEFEELCEPFITNAQSLVDNAGGLCALQGITAAQEAEAATVEEYQRACGVARLDCEANAAAAQALSEAAECTMPENCEATVEEIDACHQQLYLLNEAILAPLNGVEIPPCEELTPADGAVISIQIALYLATSAGQAAEATGQSIDQSGEPCTALETTCPGLAGLADVLPDDMATE